MKECVICGKKGLDFDAPLFGKPCGKFTQFSPAVGDWVCLFEQQKQRHNDVGNAQNSAQNRAESEPQDLDSYLSMSHAFKEEIKRYRFKVSLLPSKKGS